MAQNHKAESCGFRKLGKRNARVYKTDLSETNFWDFRFLVRGSQKRQGMSVSKSHVNQPEYCILHFIITIKQASKAKPEPKGLNSPQTLPLSSSTGLFCSGL